MIKVRYLVIDSYSLYNIIIGVHAFNILRSSLLTLYLCMKYMISNGHVGVVQRDQETAQRCYQNSLRLKKEMMVVAHAQ